MPEEQRASWLLDGPDGGIGLVVAAQGPRPAVGLGGESGRRSVGGTAFSDAVPGRPSGAFAAGLQNAPVRPGHPSAALPGVGQRLAGARRERLGPASGPTSCADGGNGPIGRAPSQGFGHADPAGTARTEQRFRLGELGVRGRGRLRRTDAGGQQDRPLPGLRDAEVGGVEDPVPDGKPPPAQDGGVLLPQGQHVRYFLHGHPVGLAHRIQGVQVAHRLGGEQGALVTAGGEEALAGVAPGGQVFDCCVHERLVDQAEALAGHAPRLTRRRGDHPAGAADERPGWIPRHIASDGQLPRRSAGLARPLIPFQADVAHAKDMHCPAPAARPREEVEDHVASPKSSCVSASASPRHAQGEQPSSTPFSSTSASPSSGCRAARSAAVT